MSPLRKTKKILEEQKKKRKKQRELNKKMTGGLDDGRVKLKKSKSSKLGSAQPSKGSKNPTVAMQNKKNGQTKSLANKESLTAFFNKYIAGSKTKIKTKTPTTKNKTKTMPDKFKTQMSKIAKNEKGKVFTD